MYIDLWEMAMAHRGITLAELIQGLLNSQYASIHPDGLFDLPLEMPDGLPVTAIDVRDGVIVVSDAAQDY
jgi:hypothetical protein